MPRKVLPEPTTPGGNTYQGSPCKRGHGGLRYVLKGACVQCARDTRASIKPTDHSRALKRAWKAANPQAVARDRAAAKARSDARKSFLRKLKRLSRAMSHLAADVRARRRANREPRALPTPAERRAASKAARDRLKASDPLALRLRERLGRKRRRHLARVNGGQRPAQSELRNLLIDARCSYCFSRDRIVLDHKMPLCRGGQDTIGNLQPLCHDCNSAKGRTPDDEYRERHSIL